MRGNTHMWVATIIFIDLFLGAFVIVLRIWDPLAFANYFMFCLIAYFYYVSKKKIYIPFFIFELFLFSLLCIDGLLPEGIVDESNEVQNTFMIVIGLIVFGFLAFETVKIIKRDGM
ncbi:hypothetical protein CI793_00285 [Anoxybacillus ayderensis]|nr:hypothetical protein B379_08170 [Anoxybacillus ayderensis G10]THD17739.1 hypothetical protein CI793_00285 [Anoxybacillus ayderensis]